jgi:glycosyltransferase involved in cell wall biosynthesis
VRICFLTHYFPPEVGAPQTRIELLARTLTAAGHDVVVHSGFPHYPAGGVPEPYRNRPFARERRGGYAVLRSAVYPAANRGFTRRLADHLAFGVSALATAGLSGPADVVVAESPPLFCAAAAVPYAALKRAALVVNVADRWPATAVELGALSNRRAIAAAGWLEDWVYGRADAITAPTAGIVAALAETRSAAGKVHRVWPVVEPERFTTGADRGATAAGSGPGDGPLSLLYAGTVGMAQGLETLVEASRLVGPGTVSTTIVGDGAELAPLRARVLDAGIVNVALPGPVPADRVPGLLAAADVAVVLLRDLEIFRGAIPTKLLEAMAAGRPLLVAARGEAAALVAEAGAGVVVAPGDPAALADGIRRLHADPGLRSRLGASGREYVTARFGAHAAAEHWQTVLAEAVLRYRAQGRSPAGAAQ